MNILTKYIYIHVFISSIKTSPQKKKKQIHPPDVFFVAKKKRKITLFWVPGHLAATLVPSTSKKRPVLLMGWNRLATPEKTPKKTPRKGRFNRGGKKKPGNSWSLPVFFCVFFRCVKLWKLWNWWWLSWVLHGLGFWAETSVQWAFAGKDEKKLMYGLVLFLSNPLRSLDLVK